MASKMKYYLGIDIGGTKTAVGVFDPDCTLIAETAFPTNPQSGCADLVHRIGVTYRKLLQENGLAEEQVTAAGVACPGPLDLASGMIVHIPTMGFRNEPIRQMLQTELEKPIHLENDANCAALAEAVKGAGKNGNSVVYITVSTGVGCGIVLNGKILDGAAFCAGEIGHLVVEPDGRPCPCGKNG
ncbi:MAG: ROK family protein, partial [Clostridia bacterium]|nr:ROK family protein [Clostridia bacterium]